MSPTVMEEARVGRDPGVDARETVGTRSGPRIDGIDVRAYRLPTREGPESDGTLVWDSTTLVLVRARAGGQEGLGYTYAHRAAAVVVQDVLANEVIGRSALAPAQAWEAMHHCVRNLLRPGLVSMAMAAVDSALWDLHARLLDIPLAQALGLLRESIPAYASGGFTSATPRELASQMERWSDQGFAAAKMKVGRDPSADPARVRTAREALDERIDLFVDANGAYGRKEALALGYRFADEADVRWFEEPVPSDDVDGLRLLRDRLPPGMDVAAGEYASDLPATRLLLDACAVDVLQLDATRIGGFTPFLRAAALALGRGVPVSAHTAPALHAPLCCATPGALHVEYFQDHVRFEQLAFDGVPEVRRGRLEPALDRPGNGLTLRESDVERWRVPVGRAS
ncbi:MAG: enolase C-terminal domain-like protein [Gemmatimonadota bacterium]